MPSRVAIILVNWNTLDTTLDCIASLKACVYPDFRIIVVDNASTDGSADRIGKMHPDIILIRSETNTGFTGGNNLGFQYSLSNGFDYSLMLNNDTFVEPDFLSILVEHLEQHPETGAVQSRIHLNHDRNLLWNGGSFFNKWTGFAVAKGENKPATNEYLTTKEVDWITGCAFLVRNKVLQETGIFAGNMFMYSEDVDLSFRIREKGYKLAYVPNSVIYHIAGVSNKTKTKAKEGYTNPLVHYYNQRNRIWILKKYTRAYQVPTVVATNFFYILMVMCYFAARGRFVKLKAMTKAVKDGLLGSIQYDQMNRHMASIHNPDSAGR
jgi:GT2 family glycosyltransferase